MDRARITYSFTDYAHGTVVRSKVADTSRSNTGEVYCRGADSDNFKATVTSKSNTREVYCTGADVDSVKVTDTSKPNAN